MNFDPTQTQTEPDCTTTLQGCPTLPPPAPFFLKDLIWLSWGILEWLGWQVVYVFDLEVDDEPPRCMRLLLCKNTLHNV